mgnify:CR=1 FL=1
MQVPLAALTSPLRATLIGADATIDRVITDSRLARPGDLFVPLVAERDGHDFVAAALAAGATAALSERGTDDLGLDHDARLLLVAHTGAALNDLARFARDRMSARVIGVTGSVGKTTVKDLMAGVLGAHLVTSASERSFNNEIGVPLTLCNAPDDVEALVVEMGARGPGHIAALCELAHPRVGQLAQRCDVAWAPGAHLHHQRFDIVGRIAQGQRDADLVVERPLARRGDQVRSQHPRHQILHGRLTHRTGDADDAGRHAVPGEAGQVVQRRPGVGHEQQAGVVVEPQIVGAALRQRRRRPSGQSGGDEVVTVALGDQRHEQVAGPGQAGIGDDPVDRGIGADQGGAKRTGQRSEGYLHARSLPRSTVPASVLNRHTAGRSHRPASPRRQATPSRLQSPIA